MKKIFYLPLVALTLASCGGTEDSTPESSIVDEKTTEETVEQEEAVVSSETPAICVIDNSLRTKEGEELKWSSNKVLFGQAVVFTGDSLKQDKNTYVKVRTIDGKEGWASGWCYAADCKRAVAISKVSLFKAPDIMQVSDAKLTLGDFIAVSNEEVGGYVEVTRMVGKNKKVDWMKVGSGISYEDIDIMLAQKRKLALAEENDTKRLDKINEILENTEWMSSPIYKDLEAMMAPAEDVYEEVVDDAVFDGEESIEDIEEGL